MENRLNLNKKVKYELPDEVVIGEYRLRPDKKRCKTPDFEPDICIRSYGKGYLGKRCNPKTISNEIWIKTTNIELIKFIESYDFEKSKTNTSTSIRGIPIQTFKKIILEEFYNKKGEIKNDI